MIIPFLAGMVCSGFVAFIAAIIWLACEERRERIARADLPLAMLVRRRSGR